MNVLKWARLLFAFWVVGCTTGFVVLLALYRQISVALRRSDSYPPASHTSSPLKNNEQETEKHEHVPSPRKLIVVTPSYNNAEHIERVMDKILTDPDVMMFIADGGSTDNTRQIVGRKTKADHRVRLVYSPKLTGRSTCINLGARTAIDHLHLLHQSGHGNSHDDEADDDDRNCRSSRSIILSNSIILVVHADTIPCDDFGAVIRRTMAREHDMTCDGQSRVVLGAFGIKTVELSNVLTAAFCRFSNATNNLRSAWCELPYGDQGHFMLASTFVQLNGYPAVPLMEDVEMTWKVRNLGRVVVVPQTFSTFAGKFNVLGPLFMCDNYLILTCWILGLASTDTLFTWYYPGRPKQPSVAFNHIHAALKVE